MVIETGDKTYSCERGAEETTDCPCGQCERERNWPKDDLMVMMKGRAHRFRHRRWEETRMQIELLRLPHYR